MRESFTLHVNHLCQEIFFFNLTGILKARKTPSPLSFSADIQILKTNYFGKNKHPLFIKNFRKCLKCKIEKMYYCICRVIEGVQKNQLFPYL